MIYMITGKIGGGKTLYALGEIVKILGKGGCVVTNIALDEPAIDQYLRVTFGRRLVEGQIRKHDFEEKPDFHKHIPWGVPGAPVVVFCDEAQLYYNQAKSRDHEKLLMDLISFITQSRKCNVDVWFITQHNTTIWAQFRHQCLFGVACRDMRQVSLPFIGSLGEISIPGIGTINIFGLSWNRYDIISDEIMEKGSTPLDKTFFSFFDTRQMYDSQMRGLQQTAEIWHPVDKKQKGKYETDSDSRGVRRWPLLCWLYGSSKCRKAENRSLDQGGDNEAAETGG